MDKSKVLKAGKIASEVREYARDFIKKGMLLIDIANKMEEKMHELGGKPAFPTCLSVNEIAAHATPAYNDSRIAEGILKIDFGVHIEGWIADTAFSIDLENSEENKKIIHASEEGLKAGIKLMKKGVELGEIGEAIGEKIESFGFSSIGNLSGHSVEHYILHAGVSIPNYNNKSSEVLEEGLYAMEPFATPGNGKVRDGKSSGIYRIVDDRNVRSQIAREILGFVVEEYQTLPFCARWLVKKFGTKALIGIKHLEENGNIHSYPELIETSGKKVAQTEHTILVEKDKVIVTTI